MAFFILEIEKNPLSEEISNFLGDLGIQTYYIHHGESCIYDCIISFIQIIDSNIIYEKIFNEFISNFRKNYNHPIMCIILQNNRKIFNKLIDDSIYPLTNHDLTSDGTRQLFEHINTLSRDVIDNINCGNFLREELSTILFEYNSVVMVDELKYLININNFMKIYYETPFINEEMLKYICEERKEKKIFSKLYVEGSKQDIKKVFLLISAYFRLSSKIDTELYLSTLKSILEDNLEKKASQIQILYPGGKEENLVIKIEENEEIGIEVDSNLFNKVVEQFVDRYGYVPRIIKSNFE